MVLATFVSVKMTCSEYDFYFTAMAQATVVSTSQNAATLKVLKPAVLEDGSRYAPEDITIKYFAKEVCCSHGGNEEEYKEFSPPCTFYCNSSSEVEQHITNLKLGTSYSVTLRTEYSTGDCVDSNPIEFKTKPYTGKISVSIAIVTYFSPFHRSSTLLQPVWIRTTQVSSLFSSFRLLYLLCTLRSLQH